MRSEARYVKLCFMNKEFFPQFCYWWFVRTIYVVHGQILVTFSEGEGYLRTYTVAHIQKYPYLVELSPVWISFTCGGDDPLTYRNGQTSLQSEILHSFNISSIPL